MNGFEIEVVAGLTPPNQAGDTVGAGPACESRQGWVGTPSSGRLPLARQAASRTIPQAKYDWWA